MLVMIMVIMMIIGHPHDPDLSIVSSSMDLMLTIMMTMMMMLTIMMTTTITMMTRQVLTPKYYTRAVQSGKLRNVSLAPKEMKWLTSVLVAHSLPVL